MSAMFPIREPGRDSAVFLMPSMGATDSERELSQFLPYPEERSNPKLGLPAFK